MLAEEDITFIKSHIGDWLAEQSLAKPPVVYEIELRERMVRVEEALRHQGEEFKSQRVLTQEILHQMDKRFEQVDKRLEQVDKRLEQVGMRIEEVRSDINNRFEKSDKRFEEVRIDINKRFEQSDKRIEEVRSDMNKRFEQSDKRFEELGRRIDRFMFWSLGITVSCAVFVVNFLK